MTATVFAFPGCEALAGVLAERLGGTRGELALRRFPDGESYVRLATPVAGCAAVLACGLHQPDAKLLPLVFAAATARELGATSVGIVAPYMGYLRQDRRFQPGEAVTSATFAKILSSFADWLVTVDPHLHRYRTLGETYSIRAAAVHAAPHVSAWIRGHGAAPFLIGPDGESEQWVAEIARRADAPYAVLEKVRLGDREVEVSVPAIETLGAHTPVLIDDIISTGRTMIAALRRLRGLGSRPPVCIGVHAIFAGDAYEALQAEGVARIATCNTISHPSNAIDLNGAIAEEAKELMQEFSRLVYGDPLPARVSERLL